MTSGCSASASAVQRARASGVPRSALFLASEVWTATIHEGPEAVQAQLEKTLADLKDLESSEEELIVVVAPEPEYGAMRQTVNNDQIVDKAACRKILLKQGGFGVRPQQSAGQVFMKYGYDVEYHPKVDLSRVAWHQRG